MSILATLRIPDIDLVNSYIRFGRNFDYMRFRDNTNIVENVSGLDDHFYHTWIDRHVSAYDKIRDI